VGLAPLIHTVWMFLYVFVLPRDRGDAGPGNPPDMDGAISLLGACVELPVAFAILITAIFAMCGSAGACVALALSCVLQVVLIGVLCLGFPSRPLFEMPIGWVVYEVFLLATILALLLMANSLSRSKAGVRGFPLD